MNSSSRKASHLSISNTVQTLTCPRIQVTSTGSTFDDHRSSEVIDQLTAGSKRQYHLTPLQHRPLPNRFLGRLELLVVSRGFGIIILVCLPSSNIIRAPLTGLQPTSSGIFGMRWPVAMRKGTRNTWKYIKLAYSIPLATRMCISATGSESGRREKEADGWGMGDLCGHSLFVDQDAGGPLCGFRADAGRERG